MVTDLYLILVFLCLPLFAPDGYVGLGEKKALLYMVGGGATALVRLFFWVRGIRENGLGPDFRLSRTEKAVLAFTGSLLLSTAFAVDRQTAVFGERGWRMGLIMQLTALLWCFFLSYDGADGNKLLYTGAAVSIGLAVLNRLEIYPLFMRDSKEFVSTLGQINWYTGYLSVILPFAMGKLFRGLVRKKRHRREALLSAFVFLGFFSAITQGSQSAFLFLGAVGILLLLGAVEEGTRGYRAFLWVTLLFLASLVLLRILGKHFPESLSPWVLAEDNLGYSIACKAYVPVLFVLCGLLFAGTHLVCRRGRGEQFVFRLPDNISLPGIAGIGLLAAAVALLLVQIFVPDFFSESFGSYRGLMWHVSAEAFREMPIGRKLIGAGPECYRIYLEATPELYGRLYHVFGDDVINAHSALLNRLLTTGILGTCSYLALMGALLWRFAPVRRELPYLLAAAGFLANNLVSFDQVTNLPILFALLGIGLRRMKMRDAKSLDPDSDSDPM